MGCRELEKKEQEVEEWRQQQKQAEAKLEETAIALDRAASPFELSGLPFDTAQLLDLLPTLRNLVYTIAQKVISEVPILTSFGSLVEGTICVTEHSDAEISSQLIMPKVISSDEFTIQNKYE